MVADEGKMLLRVIDERMPHFYERIEKNTAYPSEDDDSYATVEAYDNAVDLAELESLFVLLHEIIEDART